MTNKEIDNIYDCVDLLARNGEWNQLNTYFEALAVTAEMQPLSVLVSWATASLSVKSKILSRAVFIEKCIKLYPEPKLWTGLV